MRREAVTGDPHRKSSWQREPTVDLPSPYRDRSASIDVDSLVIGALETAFKEMVIFKYVSYSPVMNLLDVTLIVITKNIFVVIYVIRMHCDI